MTKRVLIIEGHPDAASERFGHSLAEAYAAGAAASGHRVRRLAIGGMELPLLRRAADWQGAAPTEALRAAQEDIAWAEHLVLLYPLWLGDLPAATKGFLEQVLRPGFAIDGGERGLKSGRLGGRSVRLVVTMGMPGLVYRWFFLAHSLKSLTRNVLRFCGLGPVRSTLIGRVEAMGASGRARWLAKLRSLGEAAA